MRIHDFDSAVFLAAPPEEVFRFFADAGNLDVITPPWLRFRTLTPLPIAMGEGALIDYRLRLRGITIRWRSRISLFHPPFFFVDEQLRGPYRLWVHEHSFYPHAGGTLVHDHVRYAVPFDRFFHRLVLADLTRIFRFRSSALRSLYPTVPAPCVELPRGRPCSLPGARTSSPRGVAQPG